MGERSEDFEKAIVDLEKKYSQEQVKRAREYASFVYSDHNLLELENIIQLELDYGKEAVGEVFARISKSKSKTNSQKSMRYVVGSLKN